MYDKRYLIIDSTEAEDAFDLDRKHRKRGLLGCGHHVVITGGGEQQTYLGDYPARPAWKPAGFLALVPAEFARQSISVVLLGPSHSEPYEGQMDTLSDVVREFMAEPWAIPMDNVMGLRDLVEHTGSKSKTEAPYFDVRGWLRDTV